MMKAFVSQSPRSHSLHYLLDTPDGYEHDGARLWPLVVFLHGGGQSGSELERVTAHGIPERIRKGESFPFILLAPQNPGGAKLWDDYAVMALVDEVCADHRVDRRRIILTGMSRGGDGAWRLAMNNPDRFAGVAVVSGATAPHVYASWIRRIPIWVFHGEKDPIVPLSVAEAMVTALRSAGADVRFTTYPETGHEAWDQAYRDPELYQWMMSQSRRQRTPGG